MTFRCGMNSANYFLDNLKLSGEPKLDEKSVGSWAEANSIAKALNDKIGNVATPIICREAVAPDKGTAGAIGMKMLKDASKNLDIDKLAEKTQFIVLRGEHYYVYKKISDKVWQEWDESNTKETKEFPAEDALAAAIYAFGKTIHGRSSAIIV